MIKHHFVIYRLLIRPRKCRFLLILDLRFTFLISISEKLTSLRMISYPNGSTTSSYETKQDKMFIPFRYLLLAWEQFQATISFLSVYAFSSIASSNINTPHAWRSYFLICSLIYSNNFFDPKPSELRYFLILSWLISQDNKSDKPITVAYLF